MVSVGDCRKLEDLPYAGAECDRPSASSFSKVENFDTDIQSCLNDPKRALSYQTGRSLLGFNCLSSAACLSISEASFGLWGFFRSLRALLISGASVGLSGLFDLLKLFRSLGALLIFGTFSGCGYLLLDDTVVKAVYEASFDLLSLCWL